MWKHKFYTLLSYHAAAAAAAKLLQSCLTLCDPTGGSPPGSPVPGILKARTLGWAAISFSNAWKWKVKTLSHVRLVATPRTAAHLVPPSMGLSRQEYWHGLPLLSLPTMLIRLKLKDSSRGVLGIHAWELRYCMPCGTFNKLINVFLIDSPIIGVTIWRISLYISCKAASILLTVDFL